jgi:thiol-disulfide isomerase/thioredoxin
MFAAALALQLTTVLVFTATDCPISNRYAPEIQRLATRFATDVRFVFVYPVPSDSEAAIREHRKKFGGGEWRRDPSQKLVKLTGVTVTPEVAVMTADQKILYRGRIDDRYIEFGKDRPQPTARDLERALDAVVAGKPVPVAQTRAVGCILADLVK